MYSGECKGEWQKKGRGNLNVIEGVKRISGRGKGGHQVSGGPGVKWVSGRDSQTVLAHLAEVYTA